MRNSACRKTRCASMIILGALLAVPGTAHASRLVVVLFTGFSASGDNTGMQTLNTTLQAQFGGNPAMPFSSMVFGHSEQQAAFNFIDGFNDVCCIVLIGHSLGGDAVIELSADFLAPRRVDLTIQIDSVGVGDEVLPANVDRGINYYQVSTGALEPQGAMNVVGATNINVEVLFGDDTITHTSIDDDPRLHDQIIKDIQLKNVPALSDWGLIVMTVLFLTAGTIMFGRRSRSSVA